MKHHDQVFRFLIEHTPVRGQFISLQASWQKCLQNSDASDAANSLLGEALAAVALLASTLKIKGNLTLQIRGQGALHLLVAQATQDRSIRGLVRQSRPIDDENASLQQIFEADKIVITTDSGRGKPHQGIIPLSGNSLAEALQAYFEHSEQLPTRFWLASNKLSANGMLLQRMPGQEEDDDSWNHLTQLASTLSKQELLELEPVENLHRLYHQESVRLYDAEPVRFDCSCSRDKTLHMIKSLGKEEAEDILKSLGEITVSCEFCNARYQFDAIDITQLFESEDRISSSSTRH